MPKAMKLLPNLNLEFESDIELFFYFLFYSVYKFHDVPAGAALFCDDEIGMFFTDDGTTYLQSFKACSINQSTRRRSLRILEYTAAVSSVQWLIILLVNPCFLYRPHNLLRVGTGQFQMSA